MYGPRSGGQTFNVTTFDGEILFDDGAGRGFGQTHTRRRFGIMSELLGELFKGNTQLIGLLVPVKPDHREPIRYVCKHQYIDSKKTIEIEILVPWSSSTVAQSGV